MNPQTPEIKTAAENSFAARMICRLLTWSRVPLAIGYVLVYLLWQVSLLEPHTQPIRFTALLPSLVMQLMLFVALITDWLDGMLARRWRVVSEEGAITDPLSDAILFLLVFGVFAFGGGPLCTWEAYLAIAVREVTMHAVIRPVLLIQNRPTGARWTGKFKTIFQSLVVFWISAMPLLDAWVPSLKPNLEFAQWTCRICALVSIASLYPYLKALVAQRKG